MALALCVATLAGCVTAQRSSELVTRPGVVFNETQPGWFVISGAELERPGSRANHDGVAACLATHINNSSVQLSDASRSFVGAYTGNYYNIQSSRSEGAEAPIRLIPADGSEAVVRGQTSYNFTMGLAAITRVVRFTLNIKQTADVNRYSFGSIEMAQTNTGVLANAGFGPFYDVASSYPEKAYDGLSGLADTINSCLISRSR